MADKSILTQGLTFQKRITAHWITQATAVVLIFIGQSAVYITKENNNYPHFQSTHSYFGLTALALTLWATLNGTATKYSSKLAGFVKPAHLKIGHGYIGILAYVVGVSAIFLGVNESWIEKVGDMYVKFGMLFALIITTIYVTVRSFKHTNSRVFATSKK